MSKLFDNLKNMTKKIRTRASSAPRRPSKKKDSVCPDCSGSGLKDQKTLCPVCGGSGK